MILNGKAKEDFKEWVFENYYFQDLNVLYPLHLIDTLIIEWFDSVGIYIYLETGTYFNKPNFRYKIITNDDTCIGYKEYSRKEATVEAIKKANDIYLRLIEVHSYINGRPKLIEKKSNNFIINENVLKGIIIGVILLFIFTLLFV